MNFTSIAGHPVAISDPPSTGTAGETYSMTCSATLDSSLPAPDIPALSFEWFFGPDGNAPLSSGAIPTDTVLSSNIYSSTLQFSPLSQSHAGMYTCRLGPGRLVNGRMLQVNGNIMHFNL